MAKVYNWINYRREIVTAPVKKQVWAFIWKTAMAKITPDEKSHTNPKGEFLTEFKEWDYDYDDKGRRFKCKTFKIRKNVKSALGFERGRQSTLGRVLGYAESTNRRFGHPAPGMGAYNGYRHGTKPRGKKADQLLDIAGFEDFNHAMFVWAGAGGRCSPVKHKKPLKRLYTKDLLELAEAMIEEHLGDVCDDESTHTQIHDNARTLALEALCDADCEEYRAQRIATQVVKDYSQQL